MIKKTEIIMGRDKLYPEEYSEEISQNIDKLLIALNKFREAYGKPMIVTSGWRPSSINKAAGGAKKSAHMRGLACDFRDHDGALKAFAVEMDKQGKLKEWGLWMEHPDDTPTWLHLDVVDRGVRKSNIFKP